MPGDSITIASRTKRAMQVPAQVPITVQQSEPALAVGNNVSTHPSTRSKVNLKLICTNHPIPSSEMPTKRMKIED